MFTIKKTSGLTFLFYSGAFMGFDSEDDISDTETDVERATAVSGKNIAVVLK